MSNRNAQKRSWKRFHGHSLEDIERIKGARAPIKAGNRHFRRAQESRYRKEQGL